MVFLADLHCRTHRRTGPDAVARLQSPFIVAPGNERQRRPSPLVCHPLQYIIHVFLAVSTHRNLAIDDLQYRTSPERSSEP
jgi:hypothetical protein